MEVSVHVEADDPEVVGSGDVRNDALPTFPLLRHSHPHVPIPQLDNSKFIRKFIHLYHVHHHHYHHHQHPHHHHKQAITVIIIYIFLFLD